MFLLKKLKSKIAITQKQKSISFAKKRVMFVNCFTFSERKATNFSCNWDTLKHKVYCTTSEMESETHFEAIKQNVKQYDGERGL